MTFGADLTYTNALTFSGLATFVIPTSCLGSSGAALLTCSDLNALYALLIAQPGSDVSSARCQTNGANCNCDFTFNGAGTPRSGTYSTSGLTVTTTPTTGSADTFPYCAKANQLDLSATYSAGAPSMMASMTDGNLTFIRQ